MYDLVLKGGTVVDPSVALHGVHDVAIEQGLIAKIAPAIELAIQRRWMSDANRFINKELSAIC